MILGLTGGVATGKSTFRGLLAARRPFAVFDADQCVHGMLGADSEVISAVISEFGPGVSRAGGGINRAALRPLVFSSREARLRLESILHPRVRARWRSMVADCRTRGEDLLCDIPLLFETNAEGFFDATVVVAASEHTQSARLAGRGLDEAMMQAMLASQWAMGEKVALASHVVWNDGDLPCLERQADLLLELLFP
jgi:dephospho-CoA kinase